MVQVVVVVALGSAFFSPVHAATKYKPYVLAYTPTGNLSGQLTQVKSKLTGAGFQIVGQYSPYAGADVVIVTDDTMLQAAKNANSMGGFGAVEHVGLTDINGTIQVAYLNPSYLAAAYHMPVDYGKVAATLKTALGEIRRSAAMKAFQQVICAATTT